VLPALGYLHDRGLVYCDFKPDNVIQTEEQLKLIDMGAVRRIDSDEPIYGTVGYQAPEIETDGPSVSSDLYTVGRALAVLTFEFRGFQGRFSTSLPDGVPLLEQQESFARLLRVVDDVRRQQLTVEILRAALNWCTTGQPAGNGPILGCEPNARALRFGLERSYRALARLTPEEDRRIELVDMANAIRPRTLT
jgi:serine/threonine protein kinase